VVQVDSVSVPAASGRRWFYGWNIVGLSFIASAMSMGVSAYTLGVFMRPMTEELGWSRAMISGTQSVSTFTTGLLAPLVGPVLDRRGGKALMVVGAAISGTALICLSLVQHLWGFYLFRGLLFTVGQLGMGSLVINVAISNWFVRKRGRAIAIGAMGTSVAAMTLPIWSERLIADYGWRTAWIALGLLTWVLVIPAAALIMRRRPEDMGLQPDGDPDSTQPAAALAAPPGRVTEAQRSRDAVWTRRAAMGTPALWLIIGAFGLASMGMGAMLLHLVPFLEDSGQSAAAAAGAITALGLAGLIFKPIWGMLIDRYPVRYCAMVEFLICGSAVGAILAAGNSGSVPFAYLATFYFGVGIGGVITVNEVVWANYFGRRTLGTVRSIAMPFQIISSAGGPLLAGIAYDRTGSYQGAFLFFIATYLLATVLMALLRAPQPPRTAAGAEHAAERPAWQPAPSAPAP
jgi:OFA family oxalate/formate antiporter-like MFS transporter